MNRGSIKQIFILLSILCFLLPTHSVIGQTNPPTLTIENINWSQFPQIEIEFNLWQANGTTIKDLSLDQISIVEDQNTPLQPINLVPDQNTTLDVVLVLDVSGSMQGQPLIDAKVAATRFLDRLATNDQAGLIAFSAGVDSNPEVLNPERERPLSGEIMPLYDLVDALEAGGATHLYNASSSKIPLTVKLFYCSRMVEMNLSKSENRNMPSTLPGRLEFPSL